MAVHHSGLGLRIRRWAATAVLLLLAAAGVALIYQYYVTAPWTRDGRIRVLVANVAPQVSGQIVELRIADNQAVKKGDVLYRIDPFDFETKRTAADLEVKSRAADLEVKKVATQRREAQTTLSASTEEKQRFAADTAMAQAAFAQAQAEFAQADVNLKRTEVRSPVNGYVTNLTLSVGDHASEVKSNVSIINSDSYWIDGYFEETKLGRICVGDAVEAQLMGFSQPVIGRIASLNRGISVSDASSGSQGLPSVDAVYTWVRLAERVPVRVDIVDVPKGVPLIGGLTATVRLRDGGGDGLGARLADATDDVLTFFHLREARVRNCAEPDNGTTGPVSTLPVDKAPQPDAAGAIAPGVAPSMTEAPTAKP